LASLSSPFITISNCVELVDCDVVCVADEDEEEEEEEEEA
jgi:hypothetical protein